MAALVACQEPAPLSEGPFPPSGQPRGAKGVDPLVVGHRLMAAEEYELAYDAYLRAAVEHGPTVDVLSSIGSSQLGMGRLGQAEATLRKAIEVDETFAPAWNNLGVVLMEQGKYGEARLVFESAFKIDNGQTAAIAENLKLALVKSGNTVYDSPTDTNYKLLRRGSGDYVLLSTQ